MADGPKKVPLFPDLMSTAPTPEAREYSVLPDASARADTPSPPPQPHRKQSAWLMPDLMSTAPTPEAKSWGAIDPEGIRALRRFRCLKRGEYAIGIALMLFSLALSHSMIGNAHLNELKNIRVFTPGPGPMGGTWATPTPTGFYWENFTALATTLIVLPIACIVIILWRRARLAKKVRASSELPCSNCLYDLTNATPTTPTPTPSTSTASAEPPKELVTCPECGERIDLDLLRRGWKMFRM